MYIMSFFRFAALTVYDVLYVYVNVYVIIIRRHNIIIYS